MIERRGVLAGLVASTASRQKRPPPAPPMDAKFRPLVPFFRELRALETGTRENLPVLQIGDSHTANDGFSGRMREQMQERFGDAGRGLLPPGVPFKYYKPAGVQVTAAGFSVVSSFDSSAVGPFGIAGLRQHADGPASVTMEVERPGDLAHVEIEALAQPRGGVFTVRLEPGPAAVFATRDLRKGPIWFTLKAPEATRLTLNKEGSDPVDLLSCRIRREERGVTWSNLGTIGATVDLLGRWDRDIVAQEMRREQPALIVLAFGTNEGFNDGTDPAAYPAAYAAALRRLREAAPAATLLLVGPPDGVRKTDAVSCAASGPGAGLEPPRNLAPVREAQRREAERAGLYFWDWSEAMGGRCTMAEWSAASPPLAAADHVHLLRLGYRRTAEALFSELMQGYSQFRGANPPAGRKA